MVTRKKSSDHQARALVAKYKWIGMIIIVLAVLGYAIIMKTPIQQFEVSDTGVKVVFVKPVDQRPGSTVYSQSPINRNESKGSEASNYFIKVPGEGNIPFSQIDRFIIVPGEDDPQNRHLKLVGRALEKGEIGVKYQESDRLGEFSIWLTFSEIQEGRRVISYNTRLVRHDGTTEIAMRDAYRHNDTWLTQISTDLKQLLAADGEFKGKVNDPVRLDQPRIRSLARVLQALNEERYSLVRGQLGAMALLNLCFVDGSVTDEVIHQAELQGRSLAQEVGLTIEAAYAIAEFGYSLYQQKEYLGSKVFWEAMTLLNSSDAYFFNMLGASLEGLNRLEPALVAYKKALELDPQQSDYRKNVARLQAYER